MSQSELTANDLILLGSNLLEMKHPGFSDLSEYRAAVQSFVDIARQGEFRSTVDLAQPLLDEVVHELKKLWVYRRFSYKSEHFIALALSIEHVLTGEASRKTLILTDAAPPDAVAQLTGLQPHQQTMLDDIVRCLKAHLPRPAIVVAWALGYDIVRWWIHSDAVRLAAFNAQSKSGQIGAYSDFYSHGERYVLDTCKNAQDALSGFNENTHTALVNLLIDRNRFAHANDSEATISRASVFVEKMVEIVTGKPFA